ncbi:MAG: hypothetical protein AB1330_01080 [Bacillota bacterium]
MVESDLFLYLSCPLAYHFRKSIPTRSSFSVEGVYKLSMRHLWYGLMDARCPKWRSVANVFCRHWREGIQSGDPGWRRYSGREVSHLELLYELYNREMSKTSKVVMAGQPYKADFDGIELCGEIDLIRSIPGEGVELVEVRVAPPYSFLFRRDVTLAAKSYGFRSLYGTKEKHVSVICIPSGKEIHVKFGHVNYLRLSETLRAVKEEIGRGVFYPRTSESGCAVCNYIEECRRWPFSAQALEGSGGV